MTIQDTGLPQMGHALTQHRIRDLIAQRVLPEFYPGRTLVSTALEYTRYKAGKAHVALYRLGVNPPLEDYPPLLTITFAREKQLARTVRLLSANRAAELPHSLYLPDIPCLVQLFPADHQLPLMWHAGDPKRMSDLLSTILPEQAPVRVRAIDIIRYRPGRRCVLKYDVQTASGLIEAIGKLYPQAEQATAVARKLALFGSSAIGDLSFPTLLSPPAGSSFLLMNRIPGENLGDLLERTTNAEQAAVLVRNAAVALHAFHSHRLDGPAARTVPAELAKLKQRVRGIHTVAPELAGWIDAVLQEVTVRVQHLASNDDTCAIHGEFKPNQLLVDGDRIAVVDLDRACNGDPALDVGNFMAVLRKEALVSGHVHLAEADAKFADEYIASGGRLSTLERARLAQIIATLRSLARSFEQYPGQYEVLGSAWPPLALLQDAQHLLASQ